MKVIGCLGVWSGGGWELKQSAWLMIHWEWLTGLIEKVWGLMNCRNCRLQQYIHYCTRWRQVEDRGWHTVSKWDEVELSLCFQVLHTPYSMSLKSNPITTTILYSTYSTLLYLSYNIPLNPSSSPIDSIKCTGPPDQLLESQSQALQQPIKLFTIQLNHHHLTQTNKLNQANY